MTDSNRSNLDVRTKQLILYGELFENLLQYDQVKNVINLFFTITKIVDDEAKTITYEVVEKPNELVVEELKRQATASLVKDPAVV